MFVDEGKLEERAMRSKAGPPRKVIVGTTMFHMWGEYPGLEKRLDQLGELIDEMAQKAAEDYRGDGLDIAVLPEYSTSGGMNGTAADISFPLEGPILEKMGAKARQHNCYIALSTFVAEHRQKDPYYHIGLLLDRKGQIAGIYRKVHPVLIPDGTLEGGVTPGKDFPVFECDFGKVAIQICIDMAYDDGWETLARKGAELVLWPSMSAGQINAACRAMRYRYFILSSTWRDNASLVDPTGHLIGEVRVPDRILVKQIDLSYVLLSWQPKLRDGKVFDEEYGDRAGYRYSEAEDGGIFWSNDPGKPIMEMVRELDLELGGEKVEQSRKLQNKLRGGPPSLE